MRSRGDSRGWSWRLAYWGAPLLLLFQYLGPLPDRTIFSTFVYLAFFLLCLWLAHSSSGSETRRRPPEKRLAGLFLTIFGLWGAVFGATHLFGLTNWLTEATSHLEWIEPKQAARLLVFGSAWPLGLGLTLMQNERVDGRTFLRVCGLVALAGLALMASGQRYQGLALFPDDSTLVTFAFWAAAVCLTLLVVTMPKSPGWWLAGILVPGLLLRGVGLGTWEIDPGVRDMLALITSAHDSLLSGENPYRLHQMQADSVVPLTYLPGLWLSYLPPRLLGLDIRWMGLVADLVVVGSLWLAARGGFRRDLTASRAIDWRMAAALGLGAVWLFLPSIHWNGIYAEAHLWWGVLAALLAAVALRRWWLAAALLGLAVCTRHFGVVVLPFVLVAMVRDLGWRQTVPRLAISGAIAATLLTPFVAWDSDSFWFGTFRWLREYGPEHQNWFYGKIGFAGPLYEEGLEGVLPYAQIAAVGLPLLGALVAIAPRDNRAFFGLAGSAYVLFVMFNGLIWHSFYLGAALFVAFAIAGGPRGPKERPTRVETIAWRFGAVVFTASVALGAWMATTLVDAGEPSGLDEARGYLSEELGEGDLLVDQTDWRVAFVEGETLFEEEEEPGGVTVVRDLLGREGSSPAELFGDDEAPERMWLVSRGLSHLDDPDEFAELGRVEADRNFGDVRVVGVELDAKKTRLFEETERLEARFEGDDGRSRSLVPKTSGEPVGVDNPAVAEEGPGWLRVEPKRCRIEGRRVEMIYAHPKSDGALRLVWEDLPVGDTFLMTAGIESPAVRWGRQAVEVDVRVDSESVDAFDIPNLPGLRWRAFSTEKWSGERADVE
ncbi:MAG: hypothetical protein ACOCV2_14340, partial [Persicimonas sp.]